jgi:hypothetical protein
MEADGEDHIGVTLERGAPLSTANVPQAYGLIDAAAGQQATIGAEADREYVSRMARERGETISTVDIPEPHALVMTATG